MGLKKFDQDNTKWPRPDFSVNDKYPKIKVKWQFQDKSDIGTGITFSGKMAIYANASGEIVALNKNSGKTIWRYQTSGKIYSTPAISDKWVICASTDKNIYCLDLKTGQLEWKFATNRPIVASPSIDRGTVFIGSSEGIFRAVDLKSGKLIWQFEQVKNFVESKTLIYEGVVYFGSWGNAFYALDQQTGKLLWKREKYANRMLSPAAVWPVAANGKIFIVAPDQRMTALDCKTGAEIWDSGKYTCRESIGISKDGKLVYIKNMKEGNFLAFSTAAKEQSLVWECKAELGYEIAPSPITENEKLIFVPTTNGIVVAIDKNTNLVAWKYKLSNALINAIQPVGERRVLVTVLDGRVACLEF